MIDIESKQSRIRIRWSTPSYNYSKDGVDKIKSIASQKYGIPKNLIEVEDQSYIVDEDGNKISVTTTTVDNIQDPGFQQKLFQDYLRINGIEDCDFEIIKKIDADINGQIDYQTYDRFKRYSVNYLKFSNFLSYGTNNYIDFRDFKGFVLLNGEPSNTSGKTTFAIDLLRFLLFGRTQKAATLSDVFNKHCPEETTVDVEGSFTIDDEEYIIKRTLTRPQASKRTDKSKVTQKVNYYKVKAGNRVELEDDSEDLRGDDNRQTNKIIKEVIGNESDFNLMIAITSSNIRELIEKTDTEKGRLLSRWIGLLPIEKKEEIAKDKYKYQIKPYLISNKYNQTSLNNEIEAFKITNKSLKEQIKQTEEKSKLIFEEVNTQMKERDSLLTQITIVDDNVLKADITTIENKIQTIKNNGIQISAKLENGKSEYEKVKDANFDTNYYEQVVNCLAKANSYNEYARQTINTHLKNIEILEKGEYCPTCKRKLDNVDNTEQINSEKKNVAELKENIAKNNSTIEQCNKAIEELKTSKERYELKSKLAMSNAALETQLVTLREEYKSAVEEKKRYNQNKEAIDRNNQFNIQIRDLNTKIDAKRNNIEANNRFIQNNEYQIEVNETQIKDREELIKKLIEEYTTIRHWGIYLDMVGKNGISKIVLRKVLPIINSKVNQILDGVCDFRVEVTLNNKNEAKFEIVDGNTRRDLDTSSGFEGTCAGLALRNALSQISSMPSCNYITLDETFGTIALNNLDKIHLLIEKMLKSYDFIMLIWHLDQIKEWCDTVITIGKENGVSYIKQNKK